MKQPSIYYIDSVFTIHIAIFYKYHMSMCIVRT